MDFPVASIPSHYIPFFIFFYLPTQTYTCTARFAAFCHYTHIYIKSQMQPIDIIIAYNSISSFYKVEAGKDDNKFTIQTKVP